ncbi:hypothetical protein MSAN_00788800 [Mycena sanguinolenta]|uniref:Uncharacterized protein n=1 Tax=Mycena sanguinolenta TaxID=230812 RepID=A0A8H7D9I5_9AGAR|nr:hypothetical protein MSAN_00788800 [Mycena sanguinolenta]
MHAKKEPGEDPLRIWIDKCLAQKIEKKLQRCYIVYVQYRGVEKLASWLLLPGRGIISSQIDVPCQMGIGDADLTLPRCPSSFSLLFRRRCPDGSLGRRSQLQALCRYRQEIPGKKQNTDPSPTLCAARRRQVASDYATSP